MHKPKRNISANVSYETAKKIQDFADDMGVTVSTVIRNVLQNRDSEITKKYLERLKNGKL